MRLANGFSYRSCQCNTVPNHRSHGPGRHRSLPLMLVANPFVGGGCPEWASFSLEESWASKFEIAREAHRGGSNSAAKIPKPKSLITTASIRTSNSFYSTLMAYKLSLTTFPSTDIDGLCPQLASPAFCLCPLLLGTCPPSHSVSNLNGLSVLKTIRRIVESSSRPNSAFMGIQLSGGMTTIPHSHAFPILSTRGWTYSS